MPPIRLVGSSTADDILTVGLERPWHGDMYHLALSVGWGRFLVAGIGLYMLANAIFAVFYLLQDGSIANARPGSFADAFFFSIQTMATIGYGQMAPGSLYANLIVTVETAFGLILLAVMTGLVFARFSRPTARVLFSRVAVIGPYNGMPTLSFRLANQRRNQILQAEVTATLLRDELTDEGTPIRRFYDLPLARYRTPVFALSFTVMHQIDRESPLYGLTAESLAAMHAELIVTASGIDETIADHVHARTSYLPDEIHWNHRFADVMGWTREGRRVIDYSLFHETVAISGDG
ncbi:MAG: ATP-sensitive inward rectifier potassium channel 10 [Alphaproteobacteria bacterium]|nr:ATP-sensitive inward rectifier potassium channel 10 [Alphaproteobacteria bacterium]